MGHPSCALKCCAYVISVPAPEIPGLVLAAARLGLTASTLFRPPSPDDEPHARSLARRDDGRCLFLDPAGACRVHATSGPAAKPTVCQLFPGQPLVTPDGRARLGVRPECPWPRVSAAPDAVARHQAALASRAAGPPGLSVRTVPAVIPLAGPGVLSAAIFCFTLAWNEFLYALVFMGSGRMKTVPVGVVSDLIKADVYFWGSLMAAGILGSVPVAIAYAFLVDNYVSGLTAGATKG